MCGQLTESFACDPRSARAGRAQVLAVCREWQLDGICDDVALPVSELVTNAVRHAQTEAALTISLTSGYIEVSVRDHDRRAPIVRPVHLDISTDADEVDGEDTGGRGICIVDAVADEWGVVQYADGKDVWFRIRTPGDWQPAQPCPCAGSNRRSPGGLPLAMPPPG